MFFGVGGLPKIMWALPSSGHGGCDEDEMECEIVWLAQPPSASASLWPTTSSASSGVIVPLVLHHTARVTMAPPVLPPLSPPQRQQDSEPLLAEGGSQHTEAEDGPEDKSFPESIPTQEPPEVEELPEAEPPEANNMDTESRGEAEEPPKAEEPPEAEPSKEGHDAATQEWEHESALEAKSHKQLLRKLETSRRWHAKFKSKGVLRTDMKIEHKAKDSQQEKTGMKHKAKDSEHVQDKSPIVATGNAQGGEALSACQGMKGPMDTFVKEWCEASGLPRGQERRKAGFEAWMASQERAALLAARRGVVDQ